MHWLHNIRFICYYYNYDYMVVFDAWMFIVDTLNGISESFTIFRKKKKNRKWAVLLQLVIHAHAVHKDTRIHTQRQRQRKKSSEDIDNINATWLIAYTWSRWQNQLCNASSLCATTNHCCNHLINKPFMNFIMEMRTICFQCIPLWWNDIKSINIWFVFFVRF